MSIKSRTTPSIDRPCRALGAAVLTGLLLGVLAPIGGCNVVAPIAYIVGGPGKIDAQHKLDNARPTVIFIDDRANNLPRRSLRVQIGQEAEVVLIERKAVQQDKMLASQAALRAALGERFGEPMSVADIGKAVGADVVIYFTMDLWTLTRDGVTLAPTAAGRVKVIDVAEQRRIWPGEEGQQVIARLPQGGEMPTTRSDRAVAEDALARAMGLELARVFYSYERTERSSFRQ